jgi:type IV pilus assembly protein PilA
MDMTLGTHSRRSDRGFTLIELLVVILIIAILAAIAVPVFLNQRKKSYVSQVQSALKNAATAIESYATDTGGDLTLLDGADSDNPPGGNAGYLLMTANGYKKATDVEILVNIVSNQYCVTATHASLTGDPWSVATYNSSQGSPIPADVDTCT